MPFLTELDDRAQVKGSRDPLGLIPIWSKFGRKIVGNLTTVTGNVRGFTTLLIGLELADILREQIGDDATEPLETFLKFEQLAGYARVKCHQDRDVRGYRRIAWRLNQGRRIEVSADQKAQILSNQRIYGLWGLFTVPARTSSLLIMGESRLTDDARSFVHRHYFPMLAEAGGLQTVLDLLKRHSCFLRIDGKDSVILDSIARMHSRRLRAEERDFYREHLAWGGANDQTDGRQRRLAELLAQVDAPEFGFREFRFVQKKAQRSDLDDRLEQIARVERLIAPAAILFAFLQARDGQTVDSVANQISIVWKRPLHIDVAEIRSLEPEIGGAVQSKKECDLWMELTDALSHGRYGQVVRVLIAINASVMERRNGAAAWIGIDAGRLRVRMSDERSELIAVEEAEDYWRSTYFLNSLWQIAREVSS